MYFNTVRKFHVVQMRSILNEDKEKMKKNVKRFFQSFFMVASLFGFIYQVSIIYDQYMSGRTIINLEIGKKTDKSMPAITICFHGLFSMERVAKYDPEFREKNKTYWDIIVSKKYSSEEKLVITYQFYESTFQNYINENLKTKGLNMNELFDKMSLKYSALTGEKMIQFSIHGNNDNIYSDKEFENDPVETISIFQEEQDIEYISCRKCLTFFSYAQKEWRNFQGQFNYINISKFLNLIHIRSMPLKYIVISIHSPNYLPEFNTKDFFLAFVVILDISLNIQN